MNLRRRMPTDLQSVPFGHSGTPPHAYCQWSWRWDSNPQPADYKSAALPIELRQPALVTTCVVEKRVTIRAGSSSQAKRAAFFHPAPLRKETTPLPAIHHYIDAPCAHPFFFAPAKTVAEMKRPVPQRNGPKKHVFRGLSHGRGKLFARHGTNASHGPRRRGQSPGLKAGGGILGKQA